MTRGQILLDDLNLSIGPLGGRLWILVLGGTVIPRRVQLPGTRDLVERISFCSSPKPDSDLPYFCYRYTLRSRSIQINVERWAHAFPGPALRRCIGDHRADPTGSRELRSDPGLEPLCQASPPNKAHVTVLLLYLSETWLNGQSKAAMVLGKLCTGVLKWITA